MTIKQRQEVKTRLHDVIDQWMAETQEGDEPFDCWIGESDRLSDDRCRVCGD